MSGDDMSRPNTNAGGARMRKKVGYGVLACLMVIYMYTFKQFHKMNAYVGKSEDNFYSVAFRSYNTTMIYMNEHDEIMHARDWVGATTQKQVTRFLREFYGEKWLQAYKTAIKFYRRYNVEKDLAIWFYIHREKDGSFHLIFENCIFSDSKIEFWRN